MNTLFKIIKTISYWGLYLLTVYSFQCKICAVTFKSYCICSDIKSYSRTLHDIVTPKVKRKLCYIYKYYASSCMAYILFHAHSECTESSAKACCILTVLLNKYIEGMIKGQYTVFLFRE